MNPVKWVIFLISLFIVSATWFKALYTAEKVFKKSLLTTILTIIFSITTLILIIMLSYALPYATWWLMHIWRW